MPLRIFQILLRRKSLVVPQLPAAAQPTDLGQPGCKGDSYLELFFLNSWFFRRTKVLRKLSHRFASSTLKS